MRKLSKEQIKKIEELKEKIKQCRQTIDKVIEESIRQ